MTRARNPIREQVIIAWVAPDRPSTDEIARGLGISRSAVAGYVRRARRDDDARLAVRPPIDRAEAGRAGAVTMRARRKARFQAKAITSRARRRAAAAEPAPVALVLPRPAPASLPRVSRLHLHDPIVAEVPVLPRDAEREVLEAVRRAAHRGPARAVEAAAPRAVLLAHLRAAAGRPVPLRALCEATQRWGMGVVDGYVHALRREGHCIEAVRGGYVLRDGEGVGAPSRVSRSEGQEVVRHDPQTASERFRGSGKHFPDGRNE